MANILKLEESIEQARLDFVKKYIVENGLNNKPYSKQDMLSLYSCLVTQAKANKEK